MNKEERDRLIRIREHLEEAQLAIEQLLRKSIAPPFARLSSEGLDFIKREEGYRATRYNDSAGHCTIGYGTLLHRGPCGDRSPYPTGITREEAEDLLFMEIYKKEAGVRDALVGVKLTQSQFDACVSLAYNIGSAAFKNSTLVRKLKGGDVEGAAKEFARWVYAGGKVSRGLVARRAREATMFMG